MPRLLPPTVELRPRARVAHASAWHFGGLRNKSTVATPRCTAVEIETCHVAAAIHTSLGLCARLLPPEVKVIQLSWRVVACMRWSLVEQVQGFHGRSKENKSNSRHSIRRWQCLGIDMRLTWDEHCWAYPALLLLPLTLFCVYIPFCGPVPLAFLFLAGLPQQLFASWIPKVVPALSSCQSLARPWPKHAPISLLFFNFKPLCS